MSPLCSKCWGKSRAVLVVFKPYPRVLSEDMSSTAREACISTVLFLPGSTGMF